MFATPEQFAATHKANIEAVLTIANSTFATVERLTALNLNTARALLEDSIASTKAMLAVKDAQEFAALQTTIAQPMLEKVVAYNRSVYEIASQSQQEAAKLVEAKIAEANVSVAAALEKAAKSAPAGSDVAVAAVKSAIAAANSAYDSVSKAAKQVVEMAEANATAAADATVKAVSTASKAGVAKKAA